jgi:hypothetical protein
MARLAILKGDKTVGELAARLFKLKGGEPRHTRRQSTRW